MFVAKAQWSAKVQAFVYQRFIPVLKTVALPILADAQDK